LDIILNSELICKRPTYVAHDGVIDNTIQNDNARHRNNLTSLSSITAYRLSLSSRLSRRT